MSEAMIRKQIYLPKRQNILLKRLANQRGVSEAEIIRQALAREAEAPNPLQDSEKAFAQMLAFAEARKAKYADQGEPFQWNRNELYEEREARWFKPEAEK